MNIVMKDTMFLLDPAHAAERHECRQGGQGARGGGCQQKQITLRREILVLLAPPIFVLLEIFEPFAVCV